MKLYYYNESHLFHCYTECGESFNIYGLIERRYSVLRKDFNIYHIYLSLKNKFGFDDCDFFNETRYVRDKDKYKARKHNDVKLPQFNKGVLDSFIKYYTPEWISDGISKESMDKFNILYSISQNRIIIPHYDLNGELVGIRGRALNPEDIEVFGKYMPIKLEKTWYTHPLSLNLYGLNQTKEAINKKKQAIIFEAEKSVLLMDGFYGEDNNSVAVCGSNFTNVQLKLLLKNCDINEIVIAFDKEYKRLDSARAQKYFNKLHRICTNYNKYCNFSFIYDRENLLNEKDSPIDRGKEVFERLMKGRIMVKNR